MRARAKLNPAMLPCFELLTDWSGDVQSHLGSCGEDGWQYSCQHRASMTACRTATMALNLVLLGLGFEREFSFDSLGPGPSDGWNLLALWRVHPQ